MTSHLMNNTHDTTNAFLIMNRSNDNFLMQSDVFRRTTKYVKLSEALMQSQRELPQALISSLRSFEDAPKLILYNYRWIVLVVYGASLIANGMAMATTISISSILSTAYGVPSIATSMCSLAFYITYIPFNFVSISSIDKYGLKVTILIGVGFTLVGAWFRLIVATGNFYFCLVGQFICGCGQPMILNCLSKFTTTWFGDNERAIATAVGSMAIPFGSLISFLLPSALFADADTPENYRYDFVLYIAIQTILMTICGVPALFLMKDKPPSPPSVIVGQEDSVQMSTGEAIKLLIKNKNYLLLFSSFILVYGNYSAMASIISSITTPYGYTVTSTSMLCVIFLIAGIFNSFFIGSILDKYQNYKKLLIIVSFTGTVFLLINIGTLPSGNTLIEGFSLLMTGAFILPISTISYSFACELAYPVPESIAIGMMITFSLIWSTILAILSQTLAAINPLICFALWASLGATAGIIGIFIKQDLKRLDQDDVKNSMYIEETQIRKASIDVRNSLFTSMNVVGGDKVKFVFQVNDDSNQPRTTVKDQFYMNQTTDQNNVSNQRIDTNPKSRSTLKTKQTFNHSIHEMSEDSSKIE